MVSVSTSDLLINFWRLSPETSVKYWASSLKFPYEISVRTSGLPPASPGSSANSTEPSMENTNKPRRTSVARGRHGEPRACTGFMWHGLRVAVVKGLWPCLSKDGDLGRLTWAYIRATGRRFATTTWFPTPAILPPRYRLLAGAIGPWHSLCSSE